MIATLPHYRLFAAADERRRPGGWRFTFSQPDGSRQTVYDAEPGVSGDRLELLAVVRALESLEGPSRITLVTPSSYVRAGLERGLVHWRDEEWSWDRFGQRVAIRDADLWQRLDQALEFHDVSCRILRLDSSASEHGPTTAPARRFGRSTNGPNVRRIGQGPHRRPQAPVEGRTSLSFTERWGAWCRSRLEHLPRLQPLAWAR